MISAVTIHVLTGKQMQPDRLIGSVIGQFKMNSILQGNLKPTNGGD